MTLKLEQAEAQILTFKATSRSRGVSHSSMASMSLVSEELPPIPDVPSELQTKVMNLQETQEALASMEAKASLQQLDISDLSESNLNLEMEVKELRARLADRSDEALEQLGAEKVKQREEEIEVYIYIHIPIFSISYFCCSSQHDRTLLL